MRFGEFCTVRCYFVVDKIWSKLYGYFLELFKDTDAWRNRYSADSRGNFFRTFRSVGMLVDGEMCSFKYGDGAVAGALSVGEMYYTAWGYVSCAFVTWEEGGHFRSGTIFSCIDRFRVFFVPTYRGHR